MVAIFLSEYTETSPKEEQHLSLRRFKENKLLFEKSRWQKCWNQQNLKKGLAIVLFYKEVVKSEI